MDWEYKILDFIRCYNTNFLDNLMVFISALGNYGFIWIILSIAFIIIKKYRHIGFTMSLSLFIMFVTGNVFIKNITDRVRPYIAKNFDIIISPPNGSSFPSGHTFSAFAAATAIFMWNRKLGVLSYIFATLIAFSRLYLYVHFPTDIVAGIILGIVVGMVSYKIIKKNYGKL